MSRLIDADKLTSAVEGHEVASVLPLNDYEYGYNSGIEMAVIEIEDAETVEAIPVDWIEAEIKALRDLDFGFTTMTAGQIEAMLNKWRKEQNGQTDKCRSSESET